jgi:hypothetical protein
MISAQQAYDLPEPTGPMMPRTKALDRRNFHAIGLVEKSKFSPVTGISLVPASLVLLTDFLCVDDLRGFDVDTDHAWFIGILDGI